MRLGTLAYDKSKEEDGVWCDGPEGLRLKIARIGNPQYQSYLRKLASKAKRTSQLVENSEGWTIKATAHHILKGWENLQDDDGKDIPFSVPIAEEFLARYSDLLQMVQEFATDMDLFRKEELEESAGN